MGLLRLSSVSWKCVSAFALVSLAFSLSTNDAVNAFDDGKRAETTDQSLALNEAECGGEGGSSRTNLPASKINAALKKRFAGKASYNQKSGELTVKYDFSSKKQLGDFKLTKQKHQVQDKVLYLDAAEELVHGAKFQSFSVSAMTLVKGMRHVGLGSTKDVKFDSGGLNLDTIYLAVPDSEDKVIFKIVPENVRTGEIPISLSVETTKTTGRWGDQVLAAPTVRKTDVHQVKLIAGEEGSYFSDLVIVGIPDADWFDGLISKE